MTTNLDALTSVAEQFLQSLDAQQRTRAARPLEDPQRFNWNYMPANREGVPLADMTAKQRDCALALLRASLSSTGYEKALGIMRQEEVIGTLEKSSGPVRDPMRYYFCVYGEPSPLGRWALGIEGHHLSVNLTMHSGRIVSATPLFFGANPAQVFDNGGTSVSKGTRLLRDEEELGFQLIRALDSPARSKAVASTTTPLDMQEIGKAQPRIPDRHGIAAADLSPDQQETLLALVRVVIGNGPPQVIDAAVQKARAELASTFFTWAGATEPNKPHSWSIYGPSIVILLYTAQSDPAGNPANHTHLLWRTPSSDFGIGSADNLAQ
ncbi:MAG: DUF3500 domain-containing protein [Candidatus Sumerlaeaceae bacterium]